MSDINNIKIEPHMNVNFGRKQGNSISAGKSIGILNRGKNTRIIKNRFKGLELGVLDEGENTIAEENSFE